ncbi:hypothetical protein D3C71_1534160 [compost metagenome]
MFGFGRVRAQLAANLIHRLRLAVPWLQLFVGERPGGRHAFPVPDLAEVFLAITGQHRAVEFRISADIVIIAGIERSAIGLVPALLGAKMALLKDGALVAIDRAVGDVIAGFKDQDVSACRRKPGGNRRAADTGADNDNVWTVHHAVTKYFRRYAPGSSDRRTRPCRD